MTIPTNAAEAPSTAKVWQQLVDNASTFAIVWILIFVTMILDWIVTICLYFLANMVFGLEIESNPFLLTSTDGLVLLGSLPTTILVNLMVILMTAIPAIYYATGRCPGPREVLGVLTRKPLRYLGAGFLFCICGAVGLLLCIVPGILVALATPLYVHYIFTTDLDPGTCLSKAFKGIFKDFGSFFIASFLCVLAIGGSILLCIVPVLAVLPMTQLYMQNYIHHKRLVSAREIA